MSLLINLIKNLRWWSELQLRITNKQKPRIFSPFNPINSFSTENYVDQPKIKISELTFLCISISINNLAQTRPTTTCPLLLLLQYPTRFLIPCLTLIWQSNLISCKSWRQHRFSHLWGFPLLSIALLGSYVCSYLCLCLFYPPSFLFAAFHLHLEPSDRCKDIWIMNVMHKFKASRVVHAQRRS